MMVLTLLVVAALASASMPAPAADTACQGLKPNDVPVAVRKSPLDSLTFLVARRPVQVCYGGKVASEAVASPVDTFTIRSVRAGRGATLLLEWERARVSIPIRPG